MGHQSYAYKLLTKRLDRFPTLRRKGGIAGFPRMDESPYDFFTTGHSSTSISAAMGYAKARDLKRESYEVVAVVGDGALLNGVSFEALNAMASVKSKVIIVLNDNKMSINPRVGGMASHLAKLAVNPTYKKFKDYVKYQCAGRRNGESVHQALSQIKQKLKSLLLPTNIFEELNISYWGPFNGHNVTEMEEVFRLARHYDEPLLIHVLTQKGKGCKAAEENPAFFHGVGPMTKIDAPAEKAGGEDSWSGVMARALCAAAERDPKVMAGTAAMKDGTKLDAFAKRYPQRFFDTGIEEEHMLVYAAGLAAAGMRPAVCIYSTFLQRAMDQVMHDICLPKLPVLLGIDRAGLVGEDGETHHGILDVSWLRAVPNMTLAAPRDAVDLEFFVEEWRRRGIPAAIRYPRGKAEGVPMKEEPEFIPIGKAVELEASDGSIVIWGFGNMLRPAREAAEILSRELGVKVGVVNPRFAKPLDEELLLKHADSNKLIVTIEDHSVSGGFGSACGELMLKAQSKAHLCAIGWPDQFIPHGSDVATLRKEFGLDVDSIVSKIKDAYYR